MSGSFPRRLLLIVPLSIAAYASADETKDQLRHQPDKVVPYKTVPGTDGTSDKLNLNVFYPLGHQKTHPAPCIVFFFGGGWNGGTPAQFHPHCAYFASRGMVAISAQYRTKKSHNVDPQTCVFDGKSAIRWVRDNAEELGIDPQKIAAGGGSAGGHVAAAVAACVKLEEPSAKRDTSCLPNALVLFNPVYDNGPDGYGHERVQEYWKIFSPLHNLHQDMPPTIAFFGTQDRLIPVATTKAFAAAMQKVGVRYDNHLYENQGHGFFNFGRSKSGTDYFVETVREADLFLGSLGFVKGDPTVADFVAKPVTVRDACNVLFIAVDDMRVELGCYGSTIVKSPHLDALAARSLLFDRTYCQQAVCNPSRASIMTGLRIDTLGFYDLPTHFRERYPDIVTLPQLFKQAGYQTHGIGKLFHNFRQDKWQGDAVSWSGPQRFHYGNHNKDLADVDGERPPDQVPIPRAEKRDVADDAYWDGKIASAAVNKLRELKDERFFLGVGFWKPHLPFNAPARYWDLYDAADIPQPANPEPPADVPPIALHDGRELKRDYHEGLTSEQIRTLRHGYYAAISYVDAQIGRVLDELDRLNLRDSTIVVFWSDHGFHLGEHDLWCKNSNFELDARVPFMISVPGQKTSGQRTQALSELLDVYPTLADYCQLKPSHELEGVSLRPVLENVQAEVRTCALTQNPRPAYRPRGVDPEAMGYSVRSDDFRYTEWRDFRTGSTIATELYDHRTDPLETQNVVADPEFAAAVQNHTALLRQTLTPSSSSQISP